MVLSLSRTRLLLLLPKPALQLHFRKMGLPISQRWCSSKPSFRIETEQSLDSKKVEQRAVATKPEMKKYMELNPGHLPEATQLRNKVGGVWNTLKGIFTNIKEKMLGNSHQNQITSETSDSASNRRASEIITSQNKSQNTEFGEPKSELQTFEAVEGSNSTKESLSTSVESHLIGESSSRDVVDATASELTKTSTCPNRSYRTEHGNPENIGKSSGANLYPLVTEKKTLTSGPSHMMSEIYSEELVKMTDLEVSKVHTRPDNIRYSETENVVQSSESFVDSHSYEKINSGNAGSHKMREISSEDQPKVKLENEHRLREEAMSGIVGVLDRNQKAEVGHLIYSMHQLPGEASKDGADEVHQLNKKIANLVQKMMADSGVGKVPTSSNGAQKIKGLADLYRTKNDRSREIPCKQSNSLKPGTFLKDLGETPGENIAEDYDIRDLIYCIKELPSEKSPAISHNSSSCTDSKQVRMGGSVERAQPQANMQDTDANRGQASLITHSMGKESNKLSGRPSTGFPFMACAELNENEQDNSSDFAASDYIKPVTQVPIPAKEDLDNFLITDFTKEESAENKVLVRFLFRNTQDSDIISAFKDCGPIVKIQHISSVKGSIFKDVYVHFKKREGLQKALKKTDLIVRRADVVVKAASPVDDAPSRILVPELIGDPDVPAALVKNPTRTVKIEQLTHDISSDQLQEALAFCGSGISSFYLGSSSCVAYVEFETEDSKERAIAKHSIYISGKQLLIFRIDAPRTTVVRVSNINSLQGKIHDICSSFGEVKAIVMRYAGTGDVHFKLCEWPNMLHILNSLNGMEVDGHRLLARPAPVFPPKILQALWSQPNERRHILAVMTAMRWRSNRHDEL
ncbi:uncharacterized protein LOC115950854 isoform X1 [Quercus lobata]|uniref:RRM domain-containing protein n=3 Tax=Quercus lobata TaxID=97700 RepID=A0A7N2LYR3_QUELO|nr:uncharacterized protein LOC115950854 isoform X1 [Quercus lobata]